MQDTHIIYDIDKLTLKSKVVAVKSTELGKLVITEKTVFHPVSYTWPDQVGDTGTIECNGSSVEVIDSIVGVTNPNGEFFYSKSIPIKRSEEGWHFFVCHVVKEFDDALVGHEVTLHVNKERRYKLSVSHSASHLAALALNIATKKYWNKEVSLDPLGNPDFDKVAMQESNIRTDGSFDRYRIGKSLKKKGFNREEFFQNLSEIETQINQKIKEWIATHGEIITISDGETLKENRYWTCSLPEGKVKFPCGGTHVKSMKIYKSIIVSLNKTNEESEIMMQTTSTLN